MTLVEVQLVRRDVEPGWPLVGDQVPLGKRYLVDLDRRDQALMVNEPLGRSAQVRVIWVVSPEPEGWMPVMAFGLPDA